VYKVSLSPSATRYQLKSQHGLHSRLIFHQSDFVFACSNLQEQISSLVQTARTRHLAATLLECHTLLILPYTPFGIFRPALINLEWKRSVMSQGLRQLLATSGLSKHLSECQRTNSKSGQGIVIHPLRVERKSTFEKHFLYRWWEIQLHRQTWLRATLSDFDDV
jgi:hypothetical protein